MKNKLKNTIKQHVINLPGWRTNRKIVVIESDDWGTIRTRSKKDLLFLKKKNINVENCHYMANDSLASESDLIGLFEVLQGVKDKNENNAVITANSLVANPNFKKIKESNYSNYFFENFTETLKKYPEHKNSFNLWQEGIHNKLFYPQSHGREHLNLSRWLRDLRDGEEETLNVFDMEMFGLSGHLSKKVRGSYLAALDGGLMELDFDRTKIIKEGLSLFDDIFKFKSKSFIAPNYVWDDSIEEILYEQGVDYIQGGTVQRISKDFGAKQILKRHYLGQKSNRGQTYLVRNCNFEPSEDHQRDWVNTCLSEIKMAFLWKKPAIVASHRVNYIGFINKANRDKNLPLLKELLSEIVKRWPDVEFMTSDQLGNLIAKNGK